jgi:hypothetical protein
MICGALPMCAPRRPSSRKNARVAKERDTMPGSSFDIEFSMLKISCSAAPLPNIFTTSHTRV